MEDNASDLQRTLNHSNSSSYEVQKKEQKGEEERPKVVVIMGPTGSGKSKLAIDLASHFPIEIINADSMQVYQGLDVLTNKVPLHDQKGVIHHLLGTVSPNVEFTAKQFRDSAISLISDILSRNFLPVIVGGTNYYIQALVSPFLLDDSAEDMDEKFLSNPPGDEQAVGEPGFGRESSSYSYDRLKDLDPVAAGRIHPNNYRKISLYCSSYARTGILPSTLYQGKAAENWGRLVNYRFNCCCICIDAALPVLDQYVEQRVDFMMDAGLLKEVYHIYSLNADYTRGLRQAIGVREFENFLRCYLSEGRNDSIDGSFFLISKNGGDKMSKENLRAILNSYDDYQPKILLQEAIDKLKANTRKLVHRQKKRLNRLETLFGWDMHHVDATESISSKSEESWAAQVVKPAVEIIASFLGEDVISMPVRRNSPEMKSVQRDLWTQFVCEACGDKVLRGAHEWEQHKQGRGHRKRVSRLKKSQGFCLNERVFVKDRFIV
ncbi:IPPT domain-containing protein/zf-C2H2_jaz domain-containing protein [Cephalotus follicularis]|uniref:IPPT domain-containing protein/zf-C2H2_jaz domain-containing protein n=1 Tax=Cephalotus follicularis TaxID=3775 RepID=A0A1Q3B4G4_CEPFO|nr:IPPT domain-containing protein/zf-C2H2_jaz domain-containing protein [Cephalotus follicularis]